MTKFFRHFFKREKGFTLTEIMIVVLILGVIAGFTTAVVLNLQKNTKSFTEISANQEALVNANTTISRELKTGSGMSVAEDYRIEFSNANGEHFMYLYYDPANPSIDLSKGVAGFAVNPATLPNLKSPALIEVKKINGTTHSAVKVLLSDVDMNQHSTGMPLFTYYSSKDEVLVTPVNPKAVAKISRVALRIVASDPNRDQPIEIATSIKNFVTVEGPNKEQREEGLIVTAPLPTVLRVQLPARTTTAVLKWDHVAGATSYGIYRDNNLIATVSEGTVTYNDANLAWGTDYLYHVVVFGASDQASVQSNQLRARTVPDRPAFTNISPTAATCSGNTVARNLTNCLSWGSRKGTVTYKIYRSSAHIGTRNSATYTYTDAGRNYGDVTVYSMIASNTYIPETNSGGDSFESSPVTLISPPAAPTVTGSSRDGVRTVNYNAVANALSYTITRVSPNAKSLATNTGVSAVVDNEAINSSTFKYGVYASNHAGNSPRSDVDIAARPAAPVLSGSHSNGDRHLTWANSSNGTSYELERVSPTVTSFGDQTRASGGTNTRTDSSTINSGTFQYRVRAKNITGVSPWSNTVSLNPRPSMPSLVGRDFIGGVNASGTRTDSNGLDGENKISWNAVANATSYEWTRTSRAGTTREGTDPINVGNSTTPVSDFISAGQILADSRYTYSVRARNKTGVSAWNKVELFQAPGKIKSGIYQFKTMGQASTSNDDLSQSNESYAEPAVLVDGSSARADAITVARGSRVINNEASNNSEFSIYDDNISTSTNYTYTVTADGNTSGLRRVHKLRLRTLPGTYHRVHVQFASKVGDGWIKAASLCAYKYGSAKTATGACTPESGAIPMMTGKSTAPDTSLTTYQRRDYIVAGTWDDATAEKRSGWVTWNGNRDTTNVAYDNRKPPAGYAWSSPKMQWYGPLSLLRVRGYPDGEYIIGHGSAKKDNSVESDYYENHGPKGADELVDDSTPYASWGQYVTMRTGSATWNGSFAGDTKASPGGPTSGLGAGSSWTAFRANSRSLYQFSGGYNYEGICGKESKGGICSNGGQDNS